jgi:hypothetical protein
MGRRVGAANWCFRNSATAPISLPLARRSCFPIPCCTAALPGTHDDRFAFLPFLYDEGGARVRQEIFRFLVDPSRLSGGTPA